MRGLSNGVHGAGWSSPEILRGGQSGTPADVYSYRVRGFSVCALVIVPIRRRRSCPRSIFACLSACLQVSLWELFTRRLPWEGMAPLQVSTVSCSLHDPRDASR